MNKSNHCLWADGYSDLISWTMGKKGSSLWSAEMTGQGEKVPGHLYEDSRVDGSLDPPQLVPLVCRTLKTI